MIEIKIKMRYIIRALREAICIGKNTTLPLKPLKKGL